MVCKYRKHMETCSIYVYVRKKYAVSRVDIFLGHFAMQQFSFQVYSRNEFLSSMYWEKQLDICARFDIAMRKSEKQTKWETTLWDCEISTAVNIKEETAEENVRPNATWDLIGKNYLVL